MIYKIYFGGHPVFLSSNLDEISEDYADLPDAIFLKDLSASSVAACWKLLEKPGDYPCFYLYHDIEKLMKALLSPTVTIEAAGGVVVNDADELLLIFRRGMWDLPKGKLDAGESIVDCALREVREETGLQNLTLQEKIGSSAYCYIESGQPIFKLVQWFKMKTSDSHSLTPQREEDITDLKWVPIHELDPYLQNTYHTIKDVLVLAQRSPDDLG
ncbi:MAG: NUDIX hydrolase [Sphingomonadales bacterium]|nr:NUDIX hydrolase [Sphingomonadales bacterium]